jgi:hypothetical protein
MHRQIDCAASLATLDATERVSWQDVAVEEYERSWPIRHADLRLELSTRIAALTGRRIAPQEVYTDGHLAACGVDGAKFRLYHSGDLVLVGGCAYCGTGHFESSRIDDLSGLGYTLSAWRPLHEDCEEYASEECPDI